MDGWTIVTRTEHLYVRIRPRIAHVSSSLKRIYSDVAYLIIYILADLKDWVLRYCRK